MQDVEIKKEEKQTGDFRSDSNFLLGYFEEKDGALLYRYDAERLIIEPWGENSFRVRATKLAKCLKKTGHYRRKKQVTLR